MQMDKNRWECLKIYIIYVHSTIINCGKSTASFGDVTESSSRGKRRNSQVINLTEVATNMQLIRSRPSAAPSFIKGTDRLDSSSFIFHYGIRGFNVDSFPAVSEKLTSVHEDAAAGDVKLQLQKEINYLQARRRQQGLLSEERR